MITDPKKAHYLTKEECKKKTAELTKLQESDPNYMIELKFIKDDAGWYADVPTHTRGQNAMVAGADTLVSSMANGHNNFTIKFRTVENTDVKPTITLKRIAHGHGIGGTYLACGASFIPFPIWLCDVTHDVVGEHPKRLYVYDIVRSKGNRKSHIDKPKKDTV